MSTSDMAAFEAMAGAAIIRRLANASVAVLDYRFDAVKTESPTTPMLAGLGVQSRSVQVDALQADVDAAPIELVERAEVIVGTTRYVITQRVDRPELGQVSLVLEPTP